MALFFGSDVIQISTDNGVTWIDLPPTSHRTPPLYKPVRKSDFYEDINGNLRQNDDRYIFEMITEWAFMDNSNYQMLYTLWRNQWSNTILLRPHKDNPTLQYEVKIVDFVYDYIKAMVGWKVKAKWRSVGTVTRP